MQPGRAGVQKAALLVDVVSVAALSVVEQILFFEVDPGEGQTGVFLCHSFLPVRDWPADFTQWVDGPTLPAGPDQSDEAQHAAAGAVLAAFGRALEQLDLPVPWPVAMGLHDGVVLYAPLPADVVTPETVPRSRIPTPAPGAYYRLDPIDHEHWPVKAVDEQGEAWLEALWGWSYGRPRALAPEGETVLELTGGDFDDCVGTPGGDFIVSAPLVRSLARHAARGESYYLRRVTLVHAKTGETRPYGAYRPTTLRPSVDLEPAHRVRVAGGRAMPAFRAVDLDGVNVFSEDSHDFRMYSVAIVSAATLGRLATDNCLSGIDAASLIILNDDDLEPTRPEG